MKPILLSAIILASLSFTLTAADPTVNVYFCVGKDENCEPIGNKGTWDVDDANKCKILIVGKNLKGKKLTVKVFREGRFSTRAKIDDVFTLDVEAGGKVCDFVPYKFDSRGDYYVRVYDENGEEIGKGQVDMEEDFF
ncbi:MAG: hypothetical protein NZM35_10635 [Chitinophagales bacterium]|nr:hypothetical protein [Chitinophagales bacterium]MDW8419786.1 hypothetical protein [Chitinophagales bacterium]